MTLSDLLKNSLTIAAEADCDVNGLVQDSRHVQAGEIFCAVPGITNHGGDFIASVIANNPAAILCDAAYPLDEEVSQQLAVANIPCIMIAQLEKQLGDLANRFYGQPSDGIPVIAVTGTNGKTSVCHYIAQALQNTHNKCAVLGTAGTGFINQLNPQALTTPDPIQLQKTLAELRTKGATMFAFEASSHALRQHRLQGCHVDTAVFTNLTRDHLDYHSTMQDYAAAKERLFQWPGLRHAVINADDPIGLKWIDRYSLHYQITAYSTASSPPKLPAAVSLIHGQLTAANAQGFTAYVTSPWGQRDIQLPLLGVFNLSNVLAVLGVLLHYYEFDFPKCLEFIRKIRGVCGRMELFQQAGTPSVVVDYAHTPDALWHALQSLQRHVQGQLWCVFGCGGMRDREKRPLMGDIAARHADWLILTNDNPRQEDPAQIIADIKGGIAKTYDQIHVEMDRMAAIEYAISHAGPNDTVLVAGKGHETYQLIGDKRLNFSDQAVVKMCLQKR